MSKVTELYKFELIKKAYDTEAKNLQVCIVIDTTPGSIGDSIGGSYSETRLDSVIPSILLFLEKLNDCRRQANVKMMLRILHIQSYGAPVSQAKDYEDFKDMHFQDALSAINVSASNESPPPDDRRFAWVDVAQKVKTYFNANPDSDYKRFVILATDADDSWTYFSTSDASIWPTGIVEARAAANAEFAPIDQRTGQFAAPYDIDVQLISADPGTVTVISGWDNTPRIIGEEVSSHVIIPVGTGPVVFPKPSWADDIGYELGVIESYYPPATEGRYFEFAAGFTSGLETVTIGEQVYEPAAIERSKLELKESLQKQSLSVYFDLDNEFPRTFLRRPNEFELQLQLIELVDNDSNVIWSGRLESIVGNNSRFEMKFQGVYTSFKRPGLQIFFQKGCPYSLYGRECKVERGFWAVDAEVLEINDLIVTVAEIFNSSYPEEVDNYFTGGICEVNGVFGYISKHSNVPGASQIHFSRAFETLFLHWANRGYGVGYGLGYGEPNVVLYPGCDRTVEMCRDRFDNVKRFGGFPYASDSRSPFSGEGIF